jgi:outer membrane protein TolC
MVGRFSGIGIAIAMSLHHPKSRVIRRRATLLTALAWLVASPFSAVADALPAAVQPPSPGLAELLTSARLHSAALREQRSVAAERKAEIDVERGSLWPSLSIEAGYTRNQNEVLVEIPRGDLAPIEATILPTDQISATVQLTVPIFDLAARHRVRTATASADAAAAAIASSSSDVERAVVNAYYSWLGGTALISSGQASERGAVATMQVAETRRTAALGLELDVARARAAVAQARRTIAEGALIVAQARRQLRTLTGVELDRAARELPLQADAELPLASWLTAIDQLAEVKSASASARATTALLAASTAALLPRVSAFAREQVNNAAGFGDAATFAAGVTLSWQLDRTTLAQRTATRASSTTSRVRRDRVADDARDRIIDAWDRVENLRAVVEAAAAEVDAANVAVAVSERRLRDGTGTQSDVIEAQSLQRVAEVGVIRARADWAAARALLRLAAGREVAP